MKANNQHDSKSTMSIDTEKQILKLLENKEFAKLEPILWVSLLNCCPHSYEVSYDFKAKDTIEVKYKINQILDLEGVNKKL